MLTPAVKFVAVSGAGLLLDIAFAILLHERVLLPLWVAALISFFAVSLLNYVLFEFWVFRRSGQAASGRRLFLVLAAACCAAATRAVWILGIEPIAVGLPIVDIIRDVGVLGSAAGVSLLVNFFLNKRIFAPRIGCEKEGKCNGRLSRP